MILFSPGLRAVSQEGEILRRTSLLNSIYDKDFFLLPVDNPREALLWILASFSSALTIVPIPAGLPQPAQNGLLAQLPAGSCVSLGDLPATPAFHQRAPKSLDQPWAVIFSSGSSGEQKAIALSGAALKSSALAHAKHSGIRSGAWLLNLPLFHVGGFSIVSRAFFLGTEIALGGSKFSAAETWAWVQAGVTGMSLVPATLRRFLAESSSAIPPGLKMILVGGAPVPEDLHRISRERNLPVFRTYGMTEHCSQIATEPAPGLGLAPLPGVELRIEQDGEISVRSACLSAGVYLRGEFLPLPTAEGFYRTGDLGSITAGRLTVTGRKSDLIISGGVNIFPAEIESQLADYPGLADFAAAGIEDPEWGEAACAAVVPVTGEIDLSALHGFLRARLDRRKMPKHIIILSQIPRTPLGKIIRAELRALLEKKIFGQA